MGKSSISYLDWMVSTQSFHCRKVSPGCQNCYAERMVVGFGGTFEGMPAPEMAPTIARRFEEIPAGNVCGLDFVSDLGLADIKHWHYVFAKVGQRPDCQFVFTTKRIERFQAHDKELRWPANLWVGVSAENQDYAYRWDILKSLSCNHRWLSVEPMLGIVEVDLTLCEWLVTGGESGKNRRHFDPQWAMNLGEQALEIGTTWYHKQSSCEKPDTDRMLFGREYNGKPAAFQRAAVAAKPAEQMRLF